MDNQDRVERIKESLQKEVGCAYEDIRVVYSPLRISPLGAHIDHQDGLVTGMTLDRAILLAFVPRPDRTIRVKSLNFTGTIEFELDHVPPKIQGDWGNYVRGAVLALERNHDLCVGIDALVEGDMPIGGLSSSAAVGIAYLLALEAANDLAVTPEENIWHDRYVENIYLGLKNGILDQSIILMSDRDHLTFLDCQSFQFAKYPTPVNDGHFGVVVVHSGVAESLTFTDYNCRVEECQRAAQSLLELAGEPIRGKPKLRMVSEDVYETYVGRLPEPLNRRARHFFTENRRVRSGVDAWATGDLVKFGSLINASGASSVQDYESGCPELITLYEILRDCPGVYGARFSGGGFRGSCIGLVDPAYRDRILDTVRSRYPRAHPHIENLYSIHFCKLDGPARLWEIDERENIEKEHRAAALASF